MLSVLTFCAAIAAATAAPWTLDSTGPWASREGLMVAPIADTLYLTGGRSTFGVGFKNDVWSSQNGSEWKEVTSSAPWGKRSYHILIPRDGCLFLMGGQTFTTFYSDVWKSCDGATWEKLTDKAAWPARAGLGGTEHNGTLVIAGGCYNAGPLGTRRSFWGDVWSSVDGETWTEMTNSAPWKARSGPRLVSYLDKLFIIAGEVGFTPSTQLADVWSSADGGASWDLVTAAPAYSARSGHGVVVHPSGNSLIMVAGWPELHDMFTSTDGAVWKKVSDSVWGCTGAARNDTCGKFDFWPVVHAGRLLTIGGSGSFATFGKMYSETWSTQIDF